MKAFYKRIIDTAHDIQRYYLDDIRVDPKDFTRNRKIELSDLFLQMLSNKGMSQKNEIYNFYEDVNKNMEVSQTAFYNARMKFNPEALLKIMQDITADEYYEPDKLVTLKDYYVLAVDGSDFVLPNTEENREKYGEAQSKDNYGDAYALASVSTCFDCLNKLFLDVSINKYKDQSSQIVSNHIKAIQTLLPQGMKKLMIFDRGYVSIRIIANMIERNEFFLIRLSKDKFVKEQNLLNEENNDQWINIVYDQTRTNHYRRDFEFREKLLNSNYKLRFIRLPIKDSSGKIKDISFITNLPDKDFKTNDFYELYHLRWDIETSYRSLKSQLSVEEFSGYRDALIRQDIYAAAFVYNAVSMTIAESKDKTNELEKEYKHEMKTNRNFALGVLKKDLIKMFILYDNKELAREAQKRFEENILKYSCPIRKGRSNKRIKKNKNKSKLSYRKSF